MYSNPGLSPVFWITAPHQSGPTAVEWPGVCIWGGGGGGVTGGRPKR